MESFGDFGKEMKKIADGIQDNADRIVRKCALAVDAALVIATPVDTGRARSNWQVSLDTPVTGTVEPYSPGNDGSTSGPNAQAAIAQGKATIGSYKGGGANNSINITNNLPYIGRLNEGYSAQAPAGFVEKAVMVGIAAIKDENVVVNLRSQP